MSTRSARASGGKDFFMVRASLTPDWVRSWHDQIAATAGMLEITGASRLPEAVVSLATRLIPGCRWSSLLLPPAAAGASTGCATLHDAASSPVMVGVLAADARSRQGPLRSLMRGRNLDADPLGTVRIRDVTHAPRWSQFTSALARTSPDVRSLTYLTIGDGDAVLVMAASAPYALDDANSVGDVIATSVRRLLRAANPAALASVRVSRAP